MSAVDVLAVMKEAAEDVVSGDVGLRLLRAAEAVAELIEAAGLRIEWVNGTWYVVNADGAAFSNIGHPNEVLARTEAMEALRAAIARVQGASA